MLQPIRARNEKSGEKFFSSSATIPTSSNFSSYSSLPPAPLGFNNGLMGTNGIHWQRDMDTLGSDWPKYYEIENLKCIYSLPMPRLFRLGYLEIGRDAYIARSDSRNVLSALNKAVYPQTTEVAQKPKS